MMLGQHDSWDQKFQGQYFGAVLRIGRVSAVDQAAARVRVHFADLSNMVSSWLPVLQTVTSAARAYALPTVNEHVVCLFRGNGPEDGVCIGSLFDAGNTPPFSGEVIYIQTPGGARISMHLLTDLVEVVTTGGVQITGDVSITGTLSVSETISADGDVTGNGVSLDHHTHSGVTNGMGTSGPPA